MINYSITYEKWDDESAAIGDTDDRGFISELENDSFRSMVCLLGCTEPSWYPLPVIDRDFPHSCLWFSQYEKNYMTGEETVISYHPKSVKDARYMVKAWRYANAR